jgi:hypothetical protein
MLKMYTGVDDALGSIHRVDTTDAKRSGTPKKLGTDKLRAGNIQASTGVEAEHSFRHIKLVFSFSRLTAE